jgi:hypothetical protein
MLVILTGTHTVSVHSARQLLTKGHISWLAANPTPSEAAGTASFLQRIGVPMRDSLMEELAESECRALLKTASGAREAV